MGPTFHTLSIEKDGNEAVVPRIRVDLAAHGVTVSEDQIQRRIRELLAASVKDVKAE